MRVPSRAFVAVVVFGLITVLVTIPYTLMVLADYRTPPDAPYQWIAPEEPPHALGKKVFLVLASVFSAVLMALGWRALLHGAREDARRRRRREALRREVQEYASQKQSAVQAGGGHAVRERDRGGSRPPFN